MTKQRILVGLLAVLVLGGGVRWFLLRSGASTADESTPSTRAAQPPGASTLEASPSARSSKRIRKPGDAAQADPKEGARLTRRVVVRGRVEPARGPRDEPTVFTILPRYASGQAGDTAVSGSVDLKGAFDAGLVADSMMGTVSVCVTRAGAGYVEKDFDVPPEGVVDVALTLPKVVITFGEVVDEAEKAVAGLGVIWGPDWAPLEPWKDPRRSPHGWSTDGGPPWDVTDSIGRFGLPNVSEDSNGTPRSVDPGLALERLGGRGTREDPIRLRASAVTGALLRVLDAGDRTPIPEVSGAFVVRVEDRVSGYGHLHGRDGWVWIGGGDGMPPSTGARASCWVEAPRYVPRRVEVIRRSAEGAAPFEVRLDRESEDTDPRIVRLKETSLLKMARTTSLRVEEVVSLGDMDVALPHSLLFENEAEFVFRLPPGAHRVRIHPEREFESLVAWTVEANVPVDGDPTVSVTSPSWGSLRLEQPDLASGQQSTWIFELVAKSDERGQASTRHLDVAGGGTTISPFPVGEWTLRELTPRGDRELIAGREWTFHVEPDRETVVELK